MRLLSIVPLRFYRYSLKKRFDRKKRRKERRDGSEQNRKTIKSAKLSKSTRLIDEETKEGRTRHEVRGKLEIWGLDRRALGGILNLKRKGTHRSVEKWENVWKDKTEVTWHERL